MVSQPIGEQVGNYLRGRKNREKINTRQMKNFYSILSALLFKPLYISLFIILTVHSHYIINAFKASLQKLKIFHLFIPNVLYIVITYKNEFTEQHQGVISYMGQTDIHIIKDCNNPATLQDRITEVHKKNILNNSLKYIKDN